MLEGYFMNEKRQIFSPIDLWNKRKAENENSLMNAQSANDTYQNAMNIHHNTANKFIQTRNNANSFKREIFRWVDSLTIIKSALGLEDCDTIDKSLNIQRNASILFDVFRKYKIPSEDKHVKRANLLQYLSNYMHGSNMFRTNGPFAESTNFYEFCAFFKNLRPGRRVFISPIERYTDKKEQKRSLIEAAKNSLKDAGIPEDEDTQLCNVVNFNNNSSI